MVNKVNNYDTIISFAESIESIRLISFSLFFLIFQLHIALPINDELNFGSHFRYNDTGLPTGCLFTFDVMHIVFPSQKGYLHYEVTWMGQCVEHLIAHKHIPRSKHEAL